MNVAVEMRSHWIRVAPKSSGQCLYEATQRPRHEGEKPRDDGAGEGCAGMAVAGGHKRQEESSSGTTTRRHPHQHLGFELWPPRLRENILLRF